MASLDTGSILAAEETTGHSKFPSASSTSDASSASTLKFLRVCLPAEASSIAKIDFDLTLYKIMAKVGPKRGCSPENHHVVIHTLDGEVVEGENDRKLSTYGAVDYIEMRRNEGYNPPPVQVDSVNSEKIDKVGDNYVTSSNTPGTPNSVRRRLSMGVMSSSKQRQVRMSDYSLPQTVTDINELSERIGTDSPQSASSSHFSGFANFTGTLRKPSKPMIKNLSMMIFKKGANDNGDSTPESPRGSSSAPFSSSMKSLAEDPVSPSKAEFTVTSPTSRLRNAMSEFESSSDIVSIRENEDVVSSELASQSIASSSGLTAMDRASHEKSTSDIDSKSTRISTSTSNLKPTQSATTVQTDEESPASFSLGSFAFENKGEDWTPSSKPSGRKDATQSLIIDESFLGSFNNTQTASSASGSGIHIDIPQSEPTTMKRPPRPAAPSPINTHLSTSANLNSTSNVSSSSATSATPVTAVPANNTTIPRSTQLTGTNSSLASLDASSRPSSYLRTRIANGSSSDASRSPSNSSILNDLSGSKPGSPEKIRKRTASTPVSAYATLKKSGLGLESPGEGFQYSTLKRPNLKGSTRARAFTDSKVSMGSGETATDSDRVSVTSAEDAKIMMKILLPEQQTTRLIFTKSSSMEQVLEIICQRRNLDYNSFTLEVNIPGLNLEMDRPLSYYVDDMKITEVTVVQKEKTYSTMCVSEDGKDVMILQVVNGKLQVMAGTIEKLMERLTDAELPDEQFIDTMLLTFRSFMKPPEFFDLLVSRFNCELPDNPSQEDIQYFTEMQVPTQKRVLLVFKWWVKNHFNDFAVSSVLKADLEDFTNQVQEYNNRQYIIDAVELRELIDDQNEIYEAKTQQFKTADRRGKTIDGMVGEISIEDLAQQLCLHNFQLFTNIHPIEFLNQIWTKEDNTTPCMQMFIDRSDKESYWVATEIVKESDLKKRAKLLAKFIHVTQLCKENQNFFSMFSIIAGLNMPPVQRLKKTWEVLPDKTKKVWAELEKMVDPSRNMKNFREVLALARGAIVPFLPIYLKDLIFMNDGNDSKISGSDMINFDKLRMMANRVMDISKLSNNTYQFKAVPTIQNFISKPPIEKSMTKLKQMSMECEK